MEAPTPGHPSNLFCPSAAQPAYALAGQVLAGWLAQRMPPESLYLHLPPSTLPALPHLQCLTILSLTPLILVLPSPCQLGPARPARCGTCRHKPPRSRPCARRGKRPTGHPPAARPAGWHGPAACPTRSNQGGGAHPTVCAVYQAAGRAGCPWMGGPHLLATLLDGVQPLLATPSRAKLADGWADRQGRKARASRHGHQTLEMAKEHELLAAGQDY